MATAKVYASRCAVISSTSPNSVVPYAASVKVQAAANAAVRLLIRFDLPDQVKKSIITGGTLSIHVTDNSAYDGKTIDLCPLDKAFDASVTWNTAPGSTGSVFLIEDTGPSIAKYLSSDMHVVRAIPIAKYGVVVVGVLWDADDSFYVQTDKGTNKPYITIEYEPVVYSVSYASPSSGTILKQENNTFRWSITNNGSSGNPETPDTQVSAVFRYRSSTAGTVKTIAVGTADSITVPAGTFTTETVQWSVQVTLTGGQVISSDWFTLSAAEPLSTAQAISPDNSILDGTAETVFQWIHTISTGSAQTAADIQTSTNGTSFTDLVHVTGDTATYAAPANKFSAGDLYWRVRTYNTDNKPGEWSNVPHVVVVAAPAAPSVRIGTVSPRPVIIWQAEGQQAYEVMIGDISSGVQFGTGKEYQPVKPLADGEYIISVRVQNKYGLWSPWGQVAITVVNTPGETISLSAVGSHVAELKWSTSGAYSRYVVIRNGVWIAETVERRYADPFSIGEPVYQILGLKDGSDNYTQSNKVTVPIQVDTVMISAVDDPAWLRLALADTSIRQISINASRTVKYVHYAGTAYPSAEIGDAIDGTYSFSVAFSHGNLASARILEALMGQVVCIKDPWGCCAIGVLGGYQLKSNQFYRSYSCTVTKIAWEEEIV